MIGTSPSRGPVPPDGPVASQVGWSSGANTTSSLTMTIDAAELEVLKVGDDGVFAGQVLVGCSGCVLGLEDIRIFMKGRVL